MMTDETMQVIEYKAVVRRADGTIKGHETGKYAAGPDGVWRRIDDKEDE